jgi:flagellar export protein FliJ
VSGRDFRFAPLLEWAEQREDQQSVVLAAALRAEQAAFETLQMLVDERERQLALIDNGSARIDPDERQAAVTYVEHLDRCIAGQQAAVAEAHERTEAERAVLVEIAQEKRSLEHLRERDEARALEEAERREASAVDDLNMVRHARALNGDAFRGSGTLNGKE